MDTAQYNHNDFQAAGRNDADKTLLVKFFTKAREDKAKTKEEGRPIFREVEYVDIKIPGNRGSGACRPATDGDKQRFPEHYAAFKQRTEVDQDAGTPLLEWSVISRSQAEELAFFHVKTVEQLANMADVQISKFQGLFGMREKAKLWLESAKKDKPMWEMDQKVKAYRAQVEELTAMVENLIQQVEDPDPDLNDKQQARALKRSVKAAKTKVE